MANSVDSSSSPGTEPVSPPQTPGRSCANSARSGVYVPVAVNTGSVPGELLESTLFGHVKGSFTSAILRRKGYFEMAIEGPSSSMRSDHHSGNAGQAAARHPGTRVHAGRLMRLCAWTGIWGHERRPEEAVDEGKFREDLYYRSTSSISLPPLRDRKEDIPRLVEHFFTKYCRAEREIPRFRPRRALFARAGCRPAPAWITTGRAVRELENAVERAVVLAAEAVVPASVLPDSSSVRRVRIRRDESGVSRPMLRCSRCRDFERRKIVETLETVSWSQTDAAEQLHIPLST